VRLQSLADVFGSRSGQTAILIGNGWSLAHVPRETMPTGFTIGVNRAWRWARLDYWIALDEKPYEDGKDHNPDSTHVTYTDHHPKTGIALARGNPDSRPGHLPPEATSRLFATTATFPGQIPPSHRTPHGDRLATWSSSINTAIHLALILGSRELHLYGVDLQNSPSGPRRFTGDPPSEALDEQLLRARDELQTFANLWTHTNISLNIHSPAQTTRTLTQWKHHWP
jgi:hypothetical protein